MTIEDFWAIKHAIDDEIARLGWSKEECKTYIKRNYGKDSRLKMHDNQLNHLLKTLKTLRPKKESTGKLSLAARRDKRKRI